MLRRFGLFVLCLSITWMVGTSLADACHRPCYSYCDSYCCVPYCCWYDCDAYRDPYLPNPNNRLWVYCSCRACPGQWCYAWIWHDPSGQVADQWAWVKIIKCYGPVSGPYGEKEGKAARGMASAADGSAPATLAVTLPADATLTVDDQPMQSSGGHRVFVSPALKPGVTYRYVLKAKAVRDGKPMEVTEVVQVYAGRETKATLTFDMPAVAQR